MAACCIPCRAAPARSGSGWRSARRPPACCVLCARHSAALVGLGMLAGLALASLATRPLAVFLVPGLSTFDPVTFLTVAGVFFGVSLLATLAPAVRALRVDPMTISRDE